MNSERLVSCAIIRAGETHTGFQSHADIRRKLGDEDPYKANPGDSEGFMTDSGRFVGRGLAQAIGMASGQVTMNAVRLLSSEVIWDRIHPDLRPKTALTKPKSGKRWATPKKRF